ncbi:hypothetical protein M0812_14402 [Anaeramoeba flamelloides]|uniref:Arb2 domain-containing protein n=1 Tax=Anaeramoeba flamelloides TaxID=1746091 RepID=A0AAV7ZFB8_9EUKA|nr:hypothetical protein M0812_14402 [Anaeramoeba flamelloides]
MSSPKEILKEFGYFFNEDLNLRTNDDEDFKFEGQEHYDKLGDLVLDTIQELMVTKYGLQELWLPLEKNEEMKKINGVGQVNIFATPNWKNCKKLLLLICGSGAVRAGQWARSLCINNSLYDGTVFKYLEQAKENDYGVIVLNPNHTASLTTIIKNDIIKEKEEKEKKEEEEEEEKKEEENEKEKEEEEEKEKETTKTEHNDEVSKKRINKVKTTVVENIEKKITGEKLVNWILRKNENLTLLEMIEGIVFGSLEAAESYKAFNKACKFFISKMNSLYLNVDISQSHQELFLQDLIQFFSFHSDAAKNIQQILHLMNICNLLNMHTIYKWYDQNEEGELQKKCQKWISKIKKKNQDPKPNQNSHDVYHGFLKVEKLSTPELHVDYIWENFVMESQSEKVYIVAHSYGGVSTIKLLANRPSEVMERVEKIAFTDSVHWFNEEMSSKEVCDWLYKHGRNWVTSMSPLDSLVSKMRAGTVCVSAGHTKHEWTSPSARTAIFDFFEKEN